MLWAGGTGPHEQQASQEGQLPWLQRRDELEQPGWHSQQVGQPPRLLHLLGELLRQAAPRVQRVWLQLLHELALPCKTTSVV